MKAISLCILIFFSFSIYSQQEIVTAEELYLKYQDAINKEDFIEAKQYLISILNGNYDLSTYQQALVFQALGYVEVTVGDYIQSRSSYERSISILDSAGIISKQYVESIISRGTVEKALGDFFSALTYFKKASQLLAKLKISEDEKSFLTSYLYLNFGTAYYGLDRIETAIYYFKLSESLLGEFDKKLLYLPYRNLARCYRALNQVDSASYYYRKTIKEFLTLYNDSYHGLAPLYLNYARMLMQRDSLSRAKELLLESKRIYEQKYGEMNPFTCYNYHVFAQYYKKISQYDSAIKFMDKSLMPYKNHPDQKADYGANGSIIYYRNYSSALYTEASIYYSWSLESSSTSVSKLLKAKESIDQAISVVSIMNASYYSYQNRYNLLEDKKEYFLLGINISDKLYQLTGKQDYLQNAYGYSSLCKGYEIQSQLRKKQALYEKALPAGLRDSIEQLGNVLNKDLHILDKEQDEDRVIVKDSTINARLYDGFRMYERLQNRAAEFSPVFKKMLIDYERIDFKQLQKNLKRKEAIIEYFLENEIEEGKKKMHVFLITKKDLKSFEFELDTAFLSALETVQLLSMGDSFKDNSDSIKNTYLRSLHELYSVLLVPLEKEIEGKDLIIIPDEDIHSLPFEILLTESVDCEVSNYIDLPYLLKKHAMSYAYASSFLFSDNKYRGSGRCVKSIIPSYDSLEQYGLYPLAGARSESEALSQYFSCNTVYDKYYDREEFFSLLEGGQILHLGMHAQRDENNDESTRLIIPATKDSVYSCYAYEIEALSVESPLVVLNACETAGGVFNSGDGVYNLARSFLLAGVPSAVHTLWEVEDRASAIIMEDFYKYLSRGYSKNRALQKAKLDYLESMPPAFTHPQYWAAFHLTGDVSPLAGRKVKILIPVLLVLPLLFYFMRSRRFKRRRADR